MTTLVLCVDRGDEVHRKTGVEAPVVGHDSVESLVTTVGMADPEDSRVNSILEALRVARDLEESGEGAVVAVVSGGREAIVSADRALARQIDELIEAHEPDSSVVVIDSVEDERVVPIVESRIRVDSVDRVVVRQAHDIESTYYLLKQFLADEELRGTVLVPIGVTLLAFPILSVLAGTAIAVATITATLGAFLLYKGLGIDDHLADLPTQARDAFYSGRVSIVTYVVAAGLALVGVFAGALGVSDAGSSALFTVVMAFVYYSVPWLALSALSASMGRIIDELIRADGLSGAYLNLPFGVVATGIVIRGFSAYFLQRSGAVSALLFPEVRVGTIQVASFPLTAEERLAVFVVAGVLVSLVGVRIASYFSGATLAEPEPAE